MYTNQATDTAQGLLDCLSTLTFRIAKLIAANFRITKLERVNYFRVQWVKKYRYRLGLCHIMSRSWHDDIWYIVAALHSSHPAFCHLQYHTTNDEKLPGNEARLCASFTHKVKSFVEPPLISSLTFCSLSISQITDKGVFAVAGALQVNQSLQELEWVQPFMSYMYTKTGVC